MASRSRYDAALLTASDFVFDQTPVTENAGHMVISDGAILPLSGIIENTGTIELNNSTGSGTELELIEHGVTLQGHGQVVLSDSADNFIFGTVSDVTLTNVDNTISGAGHLGDGTMVLVNEGTIIASGTNSLEIDTGTNTIVNSGTLEATGSGGLVIDSNVENSGLLWANGANIAVHGSVTGGTAVMENSGTLEATGSGGLVIDSNVENSGLLWANGANITLHGSVTGGAAVVDGVASVEFGAAASTSVTFNAGASGTLKLADSFDFSGIVSGFNQNDHIDLLDVSFGAGTTASYVENQAGTGGTLSVTDGAHTANVALLGQYSADDFTVAADHTTGTLLSLRDHLVI
jgi:hypothetical protein